MLEKPVKDGLNVYDKANELDEYYKDIKGKEPEKFCDVRYLIIEDYKEFNPEYIKESHKGWKTRAFTTDFVKEELKKENCEFISEYKKWNEPIEYVYNNVKYKVLFIFGGRAILDLTFIENRNVRNSIMNSSTIINTYEDIN